MKTPKPLTRRDFAKRSTAAVVGTMMASQMPLAANAFYTSDDTIRVGLVGCGGRGTGAALQALSTKQNVKLVAMADVFEDRLQESLANLTSDDATDWSAEGAVDVRTRIDVPQERQFVGFEAYQSVIPLVDVVILTTPPAFRPVHFAAAIEAGKHVFMEKPVATDAAGIRSVMETAEKAKAKQLNVVVGLQRHYQTVYREWVQRIHDGAIGDIVLGRVYWNSSGVWVKERAALEEQYGRPLTEMEYQMRNWYYFNWICGDHIVEQHIHNIDVANWVKRGHPVKAQGQGGRLVRTGKDHGEIYDHHFVEFEYADGSRVLSQCRHQPGCMNRVSEGFHGTMGTAPKPGELYDASGNVIYKHRGKEDPNPYQVEHDELFAAIAAGEYTYADGEKGAVATMSAILGRMATYTGQELTWDEALADEQVLVPTTLGWDVTPPIVPNADGMYPVPMPGDGMMG